MIRYSNKYDWHDLLNSTKNDYFAYTYSHLVDLINVLNTQFDDFEIVINYRKLENE